MISRTDTRDKILEYYDKVLRTQQHKFTSNKQADAFVKQTPLAFLFAVILNQGIAAERAWEMPYELRSILGHLDVRKIANMTDGQIQAAFMKLPTKPRYWPEAAKRIRNASQRVSASYQGQAANIWNGNLKAGHLYKRLTEFDGIGQKKAAMATRILGMSLNVPIQAWDEIDVAVDEMTKRVFVRAGLSGSDDRKEIISAARELSPSFPGALDYPCWVIGRKWCLPQSRDCCQCYIGAVCPQI